MISQTSTLDNHHSDGPMQLGGFSDPQRGRPDFANAGEYLAHVHDCLLEGRRPWDPWTLDELRELGLTFPHVAREFWPSPDVCLELGLPPELIDEPEPMNDLERVRFLVTLQHDEGFRNAILTMLKEG